MIDEESAGLADTEGHAVDSGTPPGTPPARVLAFTLAAIARARQFAAHLLDRLVRTAGPGWHFVACVTRRLGPAPAVYAGIHIVRPALSTGGRPRARISGPPRRRGFTALLMYGVLAEEPVGLLMRSCADEWHFAPEHSCVVRGWVARDGRTFPMRRGTVRNTAGGPLGPHPCLPPHPPDTIRYEPGHPLDRDT